MLRCDGLGCAGFVITGTVLFVVVPVLLDTYRYFESLILACDAGFVGKHDSLRQSLLVYGYDAMCLSRTGPNEGPLPPLQSEAIVMYQPGRVGAG